MRFIPTAIPARVWFLAGLVGLYTGWLIYYRGLSFGPAWDEKRFWETTLGFIEGPMLRKLADYRELNTPLPFLVFAGLEGLFHAGIWGGRVLNLILSFVMVAAIGWTRSGGTRTILAAVGVLTFPYYWQMSVLMYTDMLAAWWVFLGIWGYLRGWNVLAGLAFTLAIASRQFAIAFPAAIVAHELTLVFTGRQRRHWLTWAAPLLAVATIGGWFLLFGGLAPSSGIHNQYARVPAVQKSAWGIDPSAGLYQLAALGIYFVLPEWVLLRRSWPRYRSWRTVLVAGVVLALFAAYPIWQFHGLMRKIINAAPLAVGPVMLVIPALAAAVRFSRLNLAFWLVLMNVGVLMKAFPWEKYLLPLLIVLWCLKSWAPAMIDDDAVLEPQPPADVLPEARKGGAALVDAVKM